METQTLRPPNIPLRDLRDRRDKKVKQAAVQARILREVAAERRRQDELHQDSNCSNPNISTGRKHIILSEEMGEVSKESCELTGPPWPALERIPEIKARLRTELIQVAAVCVAWVESLEVGS